jgi:hypothetical protein
MSVPIVQLHVQEDHHHHHNHHHHYHHYFSLPGPQILYM